MGATAAVHPADQVLQAYGLGKLDDVSSVSVSKHLEWCDPCQRRVTELSSDDFLVRLQQARVKQDKATSGWSPSASSSSEGTPSAFVSPPPADTLPLELVDHPDWEILRELGRGGMGVVYLANNRLMGRLEVLKVVGRHLIERPGVGDRFLREIRSAAMLQHPNIVTAYSARQLGSSLVLAMEYVKGFDLARIVKANGPLPIAHACHFIHQAALGLQHALESEMVHRDIKPANLIVREGKKGILKVLDFGLAKVTSEGQADSNLTREGQTVGTPDFIAPEQIRDAKSADIRADIYSLGCTLYYLLTGGPPFRGEHLWDIYQAHFFIDAGPLNLVRPEVPVELAAVAAKMMAKEPERRFQTPGEVAHALTPFFKKPADQVATPTVELSCLAQADMERASTGLSLVSTSSATTVEPPPGPSATQAHSDPMWESLIAYVDTASSNESKPSVATRARRPILRSSAVYLSLLLVSVVVAMAVIPRLIAKNYNTHVKIAKLSQGKLALKDGKLKPVKGKKNYGNRDTSGFLPLFDGTLTGWMFPLGAGTDWIATGGSIRGLATVSSSTIATTRSTYGGFHLRMDVLTPDNLNKTLLIRASLSTATVKYYEFSTGSLRSGDSMALLGECRLRTSGGAIEPIRYTVDGLREITKPIGFELTKNTWQCVEIIAVGNVIRMRVDDQEVSAFEDAESRLKRGQIGIRLRQGSQIEIRNIEIKELSAGTLTTSAREISLATVVNRPGCGREYTGGSSG